MAKTIGLVGVGMLGRSIARLCVNAGYDVVIANSRGPETLTDIVADLGGKARAGTFDEACEAGDLVVLSIPMSAYKNVPVDSLAGKIVIDTLNYYPERDGQMSEVETPDITTGELLQRELLKSRVVKTMNNMDFIHLLGLARPTGAADRSAMPIASDNADAKAAGVQFLDVIGYDAVDVGSLADSWRFEAGTPIYVWPYVDERPLGMSLEEARRSWYHKSPGVQVSTEKVKELLDAAEKGLGIGLYGHLPFTEEALTEL
ncbi:NADPH-dependent F420 reductase [Rhodococcus opacus]|uniref:NADPH-dependent F420 reductase n=1 Tax=Rhodococcus opacus TaxID=37919 RepID=UPI002473B0EA|nr:NAD(P)-binding domain-containing protein [Rhodococcus opacus]MDH6292852.1 putative dinucleotide-binding enzyme [Rhodococcus opacus]